MISYTDQLKAITPEKLRGFFEGWPNPPSPETHLRLLANSDEILLAIDDETGRVVGFITAITDGVLCAYVPFLEVLPSYRDQGIGSELARRMGARLAHYYMVDLMCDPDSQPFYTALGLGLKPATGMSVRNYARQAGTPLNEENPKHKGEDNGHPLRHHRIS